MLLVLIVFSILFAIVGAILNIKTCLEYTGVVIIVVGIVLALAFAVWFLVDLSSYQQTKLLPEQITMYEEENTKIETQIATVVETYMNYEQETFKKVSIADMDTESVVALVSMFPELQSDSLVQSQIATMVANNNTIKNLRRQQIEARTLGWWLWFAPLTTAVD